MIDEVGTIWVVEYPTQYSGIQDILWHAQVTDFILQSLGGLRKEHIYGIYKSKAKAEKAAYRLMKSKPIGPFPDLTNYEGQTLADLRR